MGGEHLWHYEPRVDAGSAWLPGKSMPLFAPHWFPCHCPGLTPAFTPKDHFGLGCSAEVTIDLNQEMWKRFGCVYGGRGLDQELCTLLRSLCRGNSFFLQT